MPLDENKAEEESPKQINVFNAGVFMNPHFEKRHKGGEDAATLSLNLIAVADGVGGWAQSGIDPANYSRRLCSLIGTIAERADDRAGAASGRRREEDQRAGRGRGAGRAGGGPGGGGGGPGGEGGRGGRLR